MDTWRPYARARSVLCLVSKADEQIFKHFIGADTWKPATVTMLYTMETGTFCRIFSKSLFPSKAVDVYGTICDSYIQQAF